MPDPEKAKLKIVQIVLGHLERTIKVAANLSKELKQQLVTYLTNNREVFTWSPQKVKGISSRVMEHRLNVFTDARLVKQKK